MITRTKFNQVAVALVHIVRFPTCNHAVVCRRLGVAHQDVENTRAEISPRNGELTEEGLKAWVMIKGWQLPEWQKLPAIVPERAAAPSVSRFARVTASKAPQGPRVAVLERSPVPAEVVAQGRRSRKPDFLKVCRALLTDSDLGEAEACARHGVGGSTWLYFKKARLGLGKIGDEDLLEVVRQLSHELGVGWVGIGHHATKSPVDREDGLPAADALSEAARSSVSVNVTAAAPISGAERRHLVASILVGLLARPTQLRSMRDVVDEAGYYYDQIVRWDSERAEREEAK
jgi:hypothetical protein